MGSPPLESSTSNFPGFRFSLRPSPRLTAFAVLEGELAVACIGGGKGGPPGFRGWRKARSVPRRFTTSPHEKRELTLPPGLRRSKLGRHLQLPSGQSPIGCWQRRSEEHTSELQSLTNLVCRLLLEKKNKQAEGVRRKPLAASRRDRLAARARARKTQTGLEAAVYGVAKERTIRRKAPRTSPRPALV